MNELKEWFFNLQPRERLYLLGGGALLLIMIVYFGFWEPLDRKVERLETRVTEQSQDLAWMKAASGKVKQLQQQNPAGRRTGHQSMLSTVDQSLNSAGLKSGLQRMEPEGDDKVKLWFNKSSFDQIITMLGKLKQTAGIDVEQLSVTPSGETGRVDARITLERS